jgi:serine/threonine protein kinase
MKRGLPKGGRKRGKVISGWEEDDAEDDREWEIENEGWLNDGRCSIEIADGERENVQLAIKAQDHEDSPVSYSFVVSHDIDDDEFFGAKKEEKEQERQESRVEDEDVADKRDDDKETEKGNRQYCEGEVMTYWALIKRNCTPTPYFVQVYDAYGDPSRGTINIVQELMSRGSLQDSIDSGVIPSRENVAIVAYSIATGMT